MKISFKIFIFTYCIMMALTMIGGFWLIDYEYQDSLSQAKQAAIVNNEMLYSYVATLEETVGIKNAEDSLSRFIESMEKGEETEIVVGNEEEVRLLVKEQEAETLQSGEYRYSIVSENQATGIQVVSKYEEQYILNYHDISEILERRNQNYELYRKLIICTSVVVAAILYVFSWYITRPLTRVTKAARQISGGDYSVRMDCAYRNMKSYEVAELGRALNHLAEHTERHIRELEENARKKEDFMGSFTHEIKTPLTSIIGYADLLRTFDLEPEKRREYSQYIYTEGKRIEQLALHLLDLIVLGKTDFAMEPVSMEPFFGQLEADVRFLGEKYLSQISVKYEPAVVCGERTLLSMAVKNLIDNALKASKEHSEVWVFGRVCGEGYEIEVRDEGCGIPEEEIPYVTEPFYMVDKSRARKQGGAGLGLSLCSKIMEICHGSMKIVSSKGTAKKPREGTSVFLYLKQWEGGEAADEKMVEE